VARKNWIPERLDRTGRWGARADLGKGRRIGEREFNVGKNANRRGRIWPEGALMRSRGRRCGAT
jgi:hypothetical protein